MLIKIDRFQGAVEAVTPRQLSETFATKAVNCVVETGALQPVRAPQFVRSLPHNAKSIFRYSGNHWFSWTTEGVDVVRTPTPYDVTDRVVFTGMSFPRQTRNDIALGSGALPSGSFRLGVPEGRIPTALITGAADPAGFPQTTYYVVSYVTAWGEEGPPSKASNPVTITDGQAVRLTVPNPPSGNYNWGAGALKRIYRSNAGTQAGAFQFVADIPIATETYTDTLSSDSLGEVIPSILWDAPPDDNTARYPTGQMLGVRVLASGALVGFSGNTLVYSEPYLPHAWPYSYPLPEKIVGLTVTSTGVLVATEGKPYMAIGTSPSSVVVQEIDEYAACANRLSMVDMGEYAIYASHDGLVGLENGNVMLLTKELFTRNQWQRFNPSSIRAFRWERKYLAFYDGADGKRGFIFAPGEGMKEFTEFDYHADAGFYDSKEDTLYLAKGTQLLAMDKGQPLNYTWRSKEFQLPRPISFSVMQIHADSYPVSMTIIRDGQRQTFTATSSDPQRLSPMRGTVYQLEINSNKTIYSVALAQSVAEIANA